VYAAAAEVLTVAESVERGCLNGAKTERNPSSPSREEDLSTRVNERRTLPMVEGVFWLP